MIFCIYVGLFKFSIVWYTFTVLSFYHTARREHILRAGKGYCPVYFLPGTEYPEKAYRKMFVLKDSKSVRTLARTLYSIFNVIQKLLVFT